MALTFGLPDNEVPALDLEAIEGRLAKIPEGPYFTAFDDGEDCPNHAHSGLAVVDTGRESEWSIARHCEWGAARFIENAITDIPALIAEVRRNRDEQVNVAELKRQLTHYKEKLIDIQIAYNRLLDEKELRRSSK